MKKVLIISHFWPYRGGSRRIFGLAKYLKEFGWEPIILTGPLKRKPEFDVRYIETDYRNFFGIKTKKDLGDQLRGKMPTKLSPILRFIFNRTREIFAYPDEDRYWKYFAIKETDKLLKKEKIDAILSIWPVTAHLIAKELKERYKIPWIADFPDLWSQNANYSYSFLRRMLDKKLELKTISLANAIVTISERAAEILRKIHKQKTIYAVSHGFDPEKVNIPPINLTPNFTITYTGQIYPGKQDPLKILTALKELILERKINPDDVELRFYGPKRNWKEIEKYGLSDVFKQYGIVPEEISLKKQRESQLLLLLNWEDSNLRYAFFGKTVEYLAAQRPILATGGFGSDLIEELLKKTNAGVYAPKVEDIKRYLRDFYFGYKKKGKVVFNGDLKEINKYSYLEMAKKFADILNQLT